jgi:peptidoglycan/LPS O-acetylase OafA/YrhL
VPTVPTIGEAVRRHRSRQRRLMRNPQHYRPDIDGLRAVAVLLVVGYHAFPDAVPGGFVGVDVFFVISGYLISGILLRELDAEQFSLLGFYARRCRRILPALFTVMVAVWLLGRRLLLPDELHGLGEHMTAGATFTSNFLLWKEAGYFDGAAELKPLLHLWSLAIEEQFYLLWPLLLAFCFRRRISIVAMIATVGGASLALDVAMVGRAPAMTFYLLPTRFWELLLGCALAWRERVAPGTPRFAELRGWLALGGLAIASFAFDRAHAYPGARALAPTVAAALLISAGPATRLARLLSLRALVALGLFSYPLYLWHWPLLALLRISHGPHPSPGARLTVVAISLPLAWLTYRTVERFAQTRRWSPSRLVGFGLASAATLTLAGALTHRGLLDRPAPKEMALLAAYAPDGNDGFGHCFLGPEEGPDAFDADCSAPADLLIWGDSFAAQLYTGLKPRFSRIARMTASSCLPVVGWDPANRPHCRAINDRVLERIRATRPKTVLLEGLWYFGYQTPSFFDDLDRTIALIDQAGSRIVILGQLPLREEKLPTLLQRRFVLSGQPVPERTMLGINREFFAVDPAFSHHLAGSRVRFVPAMDALCNADGCLVTVGDNLATDLIAFDEGHLTAAGSRFVVTQLLAPIL